MMAVKAGEWVNLSKENKLAKLIEAKHRSEEKKKSARF